MEKDEVSMSSLSSDETNPKRSYAKASAVCNDSTVTTKTVDPPRELRSGMRADIKVQDEENPSVQIKSTDIAKIFTRDKEYIEVTQEQLERVKQSKFVQKGE